MPRTTFTYSAPMPRKIFRPDMRMNEKMRPMGMANGNAMSTMASAMKKPCSTTGKLLTRIGGLKNKRRNLLEFHACTHGCCSR